MHPESMPLSAHQRHERERRNRTEDDAVANTPHRLDFATIRDMAARPSALTVSILLPTHRPGSERTPDHIRAKKLLHAAELRLTAMTDAKRAQAMLSPVAAAMLEQAFWHHPQDGLAIFCRENGFRQLWAPMALPEQATVSDCCNLKTLMPACQGDGLFYVLTLTRHGVHLYSGSRFGLDAIDLPGSAAIEESLAQPDGEHHSNLRPGSGSSTGARHLGTVVDDQSKERILSYFRLIDTCVRALLHTERAPLVMAGLKDLLPIYAEANHHPRLMDAGIAGNPEQLPVKELHERAWAIVAPLFEQASLQARERYAQQRGGARSSGDLPTVLRAAHHGRIETLFVAADVNRWGTYDAVSDAFREELTEGAAANGDLLNLTVIKALCTHAQVEVVAKAQMPDHQDIAANFRF